MVPFVLGAVRILLAAQATPATIVGTVRDAGTGQPLAGAVVALTDLNRATVTVADGRYALGEVPAGPQHLTVRFIGYGQRSLHALVPHDGRLEINVSLRAQPIRLQPLAVRAPVVVRGLGGGDSTAFPDVGASIAAVWSHPLLSEPDAFQALGGGEVVLRAESPSGVHIRGGSSDQTAYLLDDIPVFSPYHAAGVFSAWNPDALAGLQLWSAAPSPAYANSLSGTVVAFTREPAVRLRAQGSVSTTQARLTLDGPLGVGGVSYLVSLRSGIPGAVAPKDEPSYLRGETGDWLAKVEGPALGGRVRFLGYDSHNEIDAAATLRSRQDPRRNVFEWHSRSVGAEWRKVFANSTVRVLGWSAAGGAGSDWAAEPAPVKMTSARHDEGVLAAVEYSSALATTALGIRVERSRTSYRIQSDSPGGPSWTIGARTPVAGAFAQHARSVGQRLSVRVGAAIAARGSDVHLAPRAQLRWTFAEPLTLSASYARTVQFAQSLRNAESVVGNVFPVDLYLGAGAPGVPVARSDQGVIALGYRPSAGVRLGLQVYERDSDGLLLVAPREGGPFAMEAGGFAVGSGASRGASVNAAVSTARYGIVGSYGIQRVRLEHAESSYVPEHGATHLLEGGLIVFPSASSSVRLGVTGALGRHTTTVSGLEWEACNLHDRGCEFGGSPDYSGEPLGTMTLPAYLRVDLGFRKHWHFDVGARDAVVALFGTVTNVAGRRNLLTYARSPSSGELIEIKMRPRAPLVIGLDWRF